MDAPQVLQKDIQDVPTSGGFCTRELDYNAAYDAATKLARSLARRRPSETDELVSIALETAWLCCKKYDSTRGPLLHYVRRSVSGRLINYLKELGIIRTRNGKPKSCSIRPEEYTYEQDVSACVDDTIDNICLTPLQRDIVKYLLEGFNITDIAKLTKTYRAKIQRELNMIRRRYSALLNRHG